MYVSSTDPPTHTKVTQMTHLASMLTFVCLVGLYIKDFEAAKRIADTKTSSI